MKSIKIFSLFSAQSREKRAMQKAEQEYDRVLLEEIFDVSKQIRNTEKGFNEITDPDLIESVIYLHNSLLAKQGYLTKLARQRNVRPHSTQKIKTADLPPTVFSGDLKKLN